MRSQLTMASTEHPVQHTTRQGAKATEQRGRETARRKRKGTHSFQEFRATSTIAVLLDQVRKAAKDWRDTAGAGKTRRRRRCCWLEVPSGTGQADGLEGGRARELSTGVDALSRAEDRAGGEGCCEGNGNNRKQNKKVMLVGTERDACGC